MASQTLQDIQKSGLVLSQIDAQAIHSAITKIATGNHETGEVFEPLSHSPMAHANTVQASTGFQTEQTKPTQKVLKAIDFKDKTLKAEGYKVGDLYPRTVVEPDLPKTEARELTQEDLDIDPTLAENGAKVGDLHIFTIAEKE